MTLSPCCNELVPIGSIKMTYLRSMGPWRPSHCDHKTPFWWTYLDPNFSECILFIIRMIYISCVLMMKIINGIGDRTQTPYSGSWLDGAGLSRVRRNLKLGGGTYLHLQICHANGRHLPNYMFVFSKTSVNW